MKPSARPAPRLLAALALAALLPAARAETRASEPIGQQTRAWLELQGRNAQPGKTHAVPGEVADRVYQRYLDSFRGPLGSSPQGGATVRPAAQAAASDGGTPGGAGR